MHPHTCLSTRTQAGALVADLLAWKPTAPSLAGRLEELHIHMYEVACSKRSKCMRMHEVVTACWARPNHLLHLMCAYLLTY